MAVYVNLKSCRFIGVVAHAPWTTDNAEKLESCLKWWIKFFQHITKLKEQNVPTLFFVDANLIIQFLHCVDQPYDTGHVEISTCFNQNLGNICFEIPQLFDSFCNDGQPSTYHKDDSMQPCDYFFLLALKRQRVLLELTTTLK